MSRMRRFCRPLARRFALLLDRPTHFIAARQSVDLHAILRLVVQIKSCSDLPATATTRHTAAPTFLTRPVTDTARAQDHRTQVSEPTLGVTTITLADPSIVMNTTPLAEPGRWRHVTSPEMLTRMPEAVRRSVSFAYFVEVGTQELRRMCAQRQMQETIVIDDFFAIGNSAESERFFRIQRESGDSCKFGGSWQITANRLLRDR